MTTPCCTTHRQGDRRRCIPSLFVVVSLPLSLSSSPVVVIVIVVVVEEKSLQR
jgi:hypothetical protein